MCVRVCVCVLGALPAMGERVPALVEVMMIIVMILVHMHRHNLLMMDMMDGHLLVDGHMHLLVDGHMFYHRHGDLLDMMMMHRVHLIGHMNCVVFTGKWGERESAAFNKKFKTQATIGKQMKVIYVWANDMAVGDWLHPGGKGGKRVVRGSHTQ